jgi:predicted site-specific integrase-resolvase
VADQDLLMTRHQAARRAGVTFNTILLWIRAGRLHPIADPDVGRPSLLLSEVDAAARTARSDADRTVQIWSVSPAGMTPSAGLTTPAGLTPLEA